MKRFTAVALAALALAPGFAEAQNNVVLQSQENLTFASGGSVVARWDGVYVGPYTAYLESDPTRPLITLYCVDFANGISVGNNWTVDVTNLNALASDFDDTRLGAGLGSVAKYRKAAYLTSLFSSYSSFGSTQFTYSGTQTFGAYSGASNLQRNVYSGIHAAIWSIMTGGFPNSFSSIDNQALASAMAAPFVALANTAEAGGFAGMNFWEYSVLTDVNSNGPTGGRQEYLVRTTVPEPETYVMMLSGLLGIGWFARRRRGQFGISA